MRRRELLRHLRAYGCVLVAAQKHNHACARTSHVLSSHSYASNEAIHKRRTGKKRYNHAHSRPVLYNGGQHMYLTKPPWYVVVGLHFDRYEKLLRYPKLATSSGEKRGGFPSLSQARVKQERFRLPNCDLRHVRVFWIDEQVILAADHHTGHT